MKFNSKFEDYLNYLRQKGLSRYTIKEHRRFLFGALSHSTIAHKKIKDLRLTDVGAVIEAGKEHGEYGSQRTVVTFRRYLKFLYDSGIKIPFYWQEIEVPRVPGKERIYLMEKELKKLLGSIPINIPCGLRTRALLEILFSTGMRIGEALSLKKEDINWKDKEAKVKGGKTGDERIVYFTERSLRWLKRYLNKRKDNYPALFVNEWETGPVKKVTVGNYLRKHQKEWSLDKHITFHTFRRTLATFLLEKGADLKAVQHILGHKSEKTTLKFYACVNKRRAKKIHQRLVNI